MAFGDCAAMKRIDFLKGFVLEANPEWYFHWKRHRYDSGNQVKENFD